MVAKLRRVKVFGEIPCRPTPGPCPGATRHRVLTPCPPGPLLPPPRTSDTMAMPLAAHRFTVDEYHRMAEAGVFHEDDRLELIDGLVVEMSPIGPQIGRASCRERGEIAAVAVAANEERSGIGH